MVNDAIASLRIYRRLLLLRLLFSQWPDISISALAANLFQWPFSQRLAHGGQLPWLPPNQVTVVLFLAPVLCRSGIWVPTLPSLVSDTCVFYSTLCGITYDPHNCPTDHASVTHFLFRATALRLCTKADYASFYWSLCYVSLTLRSTGPWHSSIVQSTTSGTGKPPIKA